jgi:ABC-type uncharacterized transport system substrate-binding protein
MEPDVGTAVHSRRQLLQGGLALVGLHALSACDAAPFPPRPTANLPRVGFLSTGSRGFLGQRVDVFLEGLRQHGYREGENVAIAWELVGGSGEPVEEHVARLLRPAVDVIVADGFIGLGIAQDWARTIPIVFIHGSDRIVGESVTNLAHPQGNITGVLSIVVGQGGKRLSLLKETAPHVDRVGILRDPSMGLELDDVEEAARQLGIQVRVQDVVLPDGITAAFEALVRAGDQAFMLANHIRLLALQNRQAIAGLALLNALPSISLWREYVQAGGLAAYTANELELYRRAADLVGKILKGAKPGDLPIEEPTTFDFIINRKTAQALGLTLPQSVLAQVTEVI